MPNRRMPRRAMPFGNIGKPFRGIAQIAAATMQRKRTPRAARTERRGKSRALLAAQEGRRAFIGLQRARAIEELNRNPQAQQLFRSFDAELTQIFGREHRAFLQSIPEKTLKEIKVMLWNGYFSPAEIRGFFQYVRENIPRKGDPKVFFREITRGIVKQRQEEVNETGMLQTVFA